MFDVIIFKFETFFVVGDRRTTVAAPPASNARAYGPVDFFIAAMSF